MHKQGRRPTRKQAVLISSKGLCFENWLVVKDNFKEIHIKHRFSGNVRVIKKDCDSA